MSDTLDHPLEHTLAEVVTAEPGAARVLEAHGLDYCCGGRRRLDDACRSAGVDPAEVLDELASLEPSPPEPWVDLDPAALVDHLEATHHTYLHAELPRLTALVQKVRGVHGGRHPELEAIEGTVGELRADLEPHLRKEELVLFPMIRDLAAGRAPTVGPPSVQAPISVMLAEHDRAGELLERLRELTDGYQPPADGCASYRALFAALAELEHDTHLHVHKENNVLFPAVVALEASPAGERIL
jgi:regulator of cell morphogenesis and NO signaling